MEKNTVGGEKKKLRESRANRRMKNPVKPGKRGKKKEEKKKMIAAGIEPATFRGTS